MRSLLCAFSLSLSLLAVETAPVAAAEPTGASVWTTDFAAAQEKAKKLNRPLVVHFYGPGCPPCRKMEAEVLNTPQVLKILDAGYVAVKVDVVRNMKVSERFGINSMPTDIILSPEGKVLVKSEGYGGGDHEIKKYVKNIMRIDEQYAAERARVARAAAVAVEDKQKQDKVPPVAAQPSVPAKPETKSIAGATPAPDKLVPPPTEPKKIADTGSANPPSPEIKKPDVPVVSESAVKEPAGTLVAMEGYCPVTLRTTRVWKPGSSDISHVHDGQTYHFTTREMRDQFKTNPAKFAPRLLGCDPVVLANSDLVVRGNVKYGAYYDGALYLFENPESRAKFRKEPVRYTKLQHAVKPEDVKKIASATAN